MTPRIIRKKSCRKSDSSLNFKLLCKSCLKSGELLVHGCGNVVANLCVELLDVLNVSLPRIGVNGEEILDGVNGDTVKTFNVDVLRVRNVSDRCEVSVDLALATLVGRAHV